MSNSKVEAVIAFMEHQQVWNSIDNQWSHPSYCVTCSNAELLRNQFTDDD